MWFFWGRGSKILTKNFNLRQDCFCFILFANLGRQGEPFQFLRKWNSKVINHDLLWSESELKQCRWVECFCKVNLCGATTKSVWNWIFPQFSRSRFSFWKFEKIHSSASYASSVGFPRLRLQKTSPLCSKFFGVGTSPTKPFFVSQLLQFISQC